MSRYEAAPWLRDLTEFQRRSVDHVFEQFYGPADAKRFLVADETGLGKTRVAQGVIARAIEELQDDHPAHRRRLRLRQQRSGTPEHPPPQRHRSGRDPVLQPADPAGRAQPTAQPLQEGGRRRQPGLVHPRHVVRHGAQPRAGPRASDDRDRAHGASTTSTATSGRPRSACSRATWPKLETLPESDRLAARTTSGDDGIDPAILKEFWQAARRQADTIGSRRALRRRSSTRWVASGRSRSELRTTRSTLVRDLRAALGQGQRPDPRARPRHPRRVPAVPAPAVRRTTPPASWRTTCSSTTPPRCCSCRPRRTSRSRWPARTARTTRRTSSARSSSWPTGADDVRVERHPGGPARLPRGAAQRRATQRASPPPCAADLLKLMSRAERPALPTAR